MQMKIRDKVRFAAIFLKSLWKPTNTLAVEVKLSETGYYGLWIDDGTGTIEAAVMYA